MSETDIAGDERLKDPARIHISIQKVLSYMQQNSLEVVTAGVHSIILGRLEDVDRVIGELASATRTHTRKERVYDDPNDRSKFRIVEYDVVEIDHHVRRSAIDALKDLRDMVASKESKTNVNFGNQFAGPISISGRSFEDRVRRLRETKGANPPEEEYLPDEEEDEDLADSEDEHIANGEVEDPES